MGNQVTSKGDCEKSFRNEKSIPLSKGIDSVLTLLGTNSDTQRKARRAIEVQQKYLHVIVCLYPQAAALVLQHTNAVYILKKDNHRSLIIYCDDSLVRADLDAKREFICMEFFKVEEKIDVVEILPSKMSMKNRHPYKDYVSHNGKKIGHLLQHKKQSERTLTTEEHLFIKKTAQCVKKESLRNSLESAIRATIKFS